MIPNLKQKAKNSLAENNNVIKRIKKSNNKNLDYEVENLHNKAFTQINCLQCANCCRTLGPRLTNTDIERIAKFLKTKAINIIEKYLRVDDDGDYVFKQMPCPFLSPDNYCQIYPQRPKACKEYPHTNRRKFIQIIDLSLKNTETCPAVFKVFEGLRKIY